MLGLTLASVRTTEENDIVILYLNDTISMMTSGWVVREKKMIYLSGNGLMMKAPLNIHLGLVVVQITLEVIRTEFIFGKKRIRNGMMSQVIL